MVRSSLNGTELSVTSPSPHLVRMKKSPKRMKTPLSLLLKTRWSAAPVTKSMSSMSRFKITRTMSALSLMEASSSFSTAHLSVLKLLVLPPKSLLSLLQARFTPTILILSLPSQLSSKEEVILKDSLLRVSNLRTVLFLASGLYGELLTL
jgi:hypothetical protein